MITLLHKEFRQHGAFALAMVFLCLIFQITYVEGCRFNQANVNPDSLFGLTLLVAVLYTGAAAAFAYSTEHSDNTFLFLRKLPISWFTIAGGKVGWVLCGTVLVLVGNLLLYGILLWTGYVESVANDPDKMWLSAGVGIIDTFVWGFFWSTRCRSQIHALLATCVCSVVTIYLITYFFATVSYDVFEMYAEVVPYRLAADSIVALFAVWGMFRWFSYEGKRPLLARLYPEKMTLRYPQRVQTPFAALVHQHIRHASILYPLGIISMILWTLGCIVCCFGWAFNMDGTEIMDYTQLSADTRWFINGCIGTGIIGVVLGMGLFWATIFGHDQKNDSYRFLSRIGIPEGRLWWSRMLPAMIFYVPVILSLAAVGCAITFWDLYHYAYTGSMATKTFQQKVDTYFEKRFWEDIWLWAPIGFTCWLAPMAMGAWMSISFRSQMVAIALTAGAMFLPLVWGVCLVGLFHFSPWWTTVPICIALLVASRIRAGYWLRETFTWRSRIIPLVPLFATIMVITAAIPLIRIYSVPLVSWEQIDTYFDKTDLERMLRAPEKRKALIQHIAKYGTVPPEYETWLDACGGDATKWELNTFSGCTAEEFMLLRYMRDRKGVTGRGR